MDDVHQRARRGIRLLVGRQAVLHLFAITGGIFIARMLERDHFKGRTVGVHIRYSDHRTALRATLQALHRILERVPSRRIFLCTDHTQVRRLVVATLLTNAPAVRQHRTVPRGRPAEPGGDTDRPGGTREPGGS